MHDRFVTVERCPDSSCVQNAAAHSAAVNPVQARPIPAGTEIIENGNLAAPLGEQADEIRANEPRSASDENSRSAHQKPGFRGKGLKEGTRPNFPRASRPSGR